MSRLGDPGAPVLVDVRAAERFSGETEPIDPVAGHIPGAQNVPSTANLEASGRFGDPVSIVERYAAAGATDNAVLYCGSGITAAHSLLALESSRADRGDLSGLLERLDPRSRSAGRDRL